MNNVSITSNLCAHLHSLSEKLQQTTVAAETKEMRGNYFSALIEISNIVRPLFVQISSCCKKAGFEDVELFEAAPKGRCENFVFLEKNGSEFTHVILAKNKSKGFLQNGGGKTQVGESISDAAVRESKEEFNFPGSERDMHQITTETESGFPIFHFVKGVHVGFVTPEQAGQLRLGDDMQANAICRMSVQEFLEVTERDTKPIDHGFDRKWIAEYIKSNGSRFNQRRLSEQDVKLALQAYEWMKDIKLDIAMLSQLKTIVQEALKEMNVTGEANGKWKDKQNRDAIREASQKIVDVITKKLLPEWTFDVKGEKKVGCQMKVQGAQGYMIGNDFLPSFLTAPQYFALKSIYDGESPQGLIGKIVTIEREPNKL